MKKYLLFILLGLLTTKISAQEKMYIHKSDKITLGALLAKTDSIYFSSDNATVFFNIGEILAQYPVAQVDSLSFGDNSNTIYVTYNGTSVSVINPLAFEGVSVVVNGADVVVTATTETRDINYSLSGTTTDGTFKIYSEKRFNLLLNSVNLTNANGPAINIQSENKAFVTLVDGTANTLTDGTTYAAAPLNALGKEEDQKSAFFSEGKLEFNGTGSLTINGKGTGKHALGTDAGIDINSGSIIIASALKDGIHAKDGVKITNGNVSVTATGDAIDGDEGFIAISGGTVKTTTAAANVKGMTCDSTLSISGGTVNMTLTGNQSKGLSSKQNMTLSGGIITINTSGGVVLETSGLGFNPSYCTAIKCDTTILVSGANITINSTGAAGKGISSDKDISISSGSVNITTSGAGTTYKNSTGTIDSYNATGISTDGNLSITGGAVTISSSGAGGKGISADGNFTIGDGSSTPTINVTTTGSKFIVSGSGQSADYAEAKAISVDGTVVINSGTTTISSADDGIKSKTSITINNGTLNITKSVEGLESRLITINNGKVNVIASDDALNATNGTGGEGNDGSYIYIKGGNITLNSSNGDGLDSNGNIDMSGGTVVVHGPQSSPEVGADVNGSFTISGGLLVVSGTNSNMTEGPISSSAQYSVIAKTTTNVAASTIFRVQDSSGNEILTFKPLRSYYSMVFSSPNLKNGGTYSIYTGGTSTGTNSDGLITGGTYSGGTLKKTFTISSKVSNVAF